jgi:glycyl-tRNA synthetase beta chain
LQGRVSRNVRHESGLLREVPDLVEYPSVIAGTFAPEFLELPDEVLTTTLIHHQHYFPVEAEDGKLKNAFLAVINTEPDNERTIARNAERVVSARLRDARFFWEADRKTTLESRIDRLATLLFHKKLGTYKEKAERIQRLAHWLAKEAFGASDEIAEYAARAARLSKADLTTDMVREFPELQGVMGGVYARIEEVPQPEEVWKAIYFHYLPIGVEADAPPTKTQLGKAAVTWAAVSLADKLDTIAKLFDAGEKPTGSRDPFGLRRAAQGVIRILVDLSELTGLKVRPTLGPLLKAAAGSNTIPIDLSPFMLERLRYLLEQRGYSARNVRAVTHERSIDAINPADARQKLAGLSEFADSSDFQELAVAFKRIRNIGKDLPAEQADGLETAGPTLRSRLSESAEHALYDEIERRRPSIEAVLARGDGYREAFAEAARFKPSVDQFFKDVLVMAPDPGVREARLRLLKRLEGLILKLADISEIVPEEAKQA